jgi:hypothetical protein
MKNKAKEFNKKLPMKTLRNSRIIRHENTKKSKETYAGKH